jgi:hypothetical protein
MANSSMTHIHCDFLGKVYVLDYSKTTQVQGCNYHGILQTNPMFRFYFSIENEKIAFVPRLSDVHRQNAITSAILNSELK